MSKILNRNDYEKLHSLTVKIPELCQTGFFMTPNIIVTCFHGNKNVKKQIGDKITCMCGYDYIDATIDYLNENDDIIFVKLSRLYEIDIIELSSDILPFDSFYSFGFTEQYPEGDSCTLEAEGWSRNPHLIKLKAGAVVPGMSGAPLLSKRNNCIVGMMKSSRTFNNRANPTGGRAVPYLTIEDNYNNRYNNLPVDPSCVLKNDLEIVYSICEAAYASTTNLKMDSDLIKYLKTEGKFIELINRNDIARRKAISLWHTINKYCLRFIVTEDDNGKHRKGVTCVLPLTKAGYESYKNGEIDEFCLGESHIMSALETDKEECTHFCIQSFAFSGRCPKKVKVLLKESFETQILQMSKKNSDLHIIAEVGTEAGRKMADFFGMTMLTTLSFDKRPLYELNLKI